MFKKFRIAAEGSGISYTVRGTFERAFSETLNDFVKGEKILGWMYEPETFRFVSMKIARRYTPDFFVKLNDGRGVYVEVKGHMDRRSIAAINRFKKNFPDKLYVVIERRFFKGGDKLRRVADPAEVLEVLYAAGE